MSDPFIHFKVMVKERASDLILREGERPAMRCEGKIRFLSEERFTPEDAEGLLGAILSAEEVAAFKVLMEKDVAFVVPGVGRFRANLFVQRRRHGFVFRHVQERVPKIEDLHLPVAPLTRLSRLQRGIVLVTGIAGSGKSTTLSALVEHMNEHTDRHIVTIEDPVEFIFRDKRCAITQREIGIDTPDYATALKHVVRQTPDVILLGEMRDRETIESALRAAESGHYVPPPTTRKSPPDQVGDHLVLPAHWAWSIWSAARRRAGGAGWSAARRGAAAAAVRARRPDLPRPSTTPGAGCPRGRRQGDRASSTTWSSASAVPRGDVNQLPGFAREGLIDYDDALAAADNPDEPGRPRGAFGIRCARSRNPAGESRPVEGSGRAVLELRDLARGACGWDDEPGPAGSQDLVETAVTNGPQTSLLGAAWAEGGDRSGAPSTWRVQRDLPGTAPSGQPRPDPLLPPYAERRHHPGMTRVAAGGRQHGLGDGRRTEGRPGGPADMRSTRHRRRTGRCGRSQAVQLAVTSTSSSDLDLMDIAAERYRRQAGGRSGHPARQRKSDASRREGEEGAAEGWQPQRLAPAEIIPAGNSC